MRSGDRVEGGDRLVPSCGDAAQGIWLQTASVGTNLGQLVIAVLGGLRIASGTASLGEIQAMIQYSRQLVQPLAQIGAMVNLLQSASASAERVFAVLDEPEEEPEVAAPTMPWSRHGLVLWLSAHRRGT